MLGTFFLTFAGVSAILATRGGDLVAIAFAQGGALALAVYAFGWLSGAHVNPAISASLFIQRKIGTRDFLMYVVFQVIGAAAAAGIASQVFPSSIVNSPGLRDGATLGVMTGSPTSSFYSPGAALLLEAIMTFMLAVAVATVVRGGEKLNAASGVIIGGTLAFCILWGGYWTGASLNPARSIGPALAMGADSVIWNTMWVYWVGPLLGGAAAGFVVMWLRGEKMAGVGSPPAAAEAKPPA